MQNVKLRLGELRKTIIEDDRRLSVQFIWVYAILAVVAAFMTLINLLTAKYLLLAATLTFSVLSILNIGIAKHIKNGSTISPILFSIEIMTLFSFFIVSGIPEGFSAIWICLLPTSGLLLFQRKRGSILCAIMFLIMVFFFDTPLGNSFLQYQYTESFRLRFPMLYIAFFAVSFFLETVRAITYDEMRKNRSQYEYLYSHDALTGVYNRHGFNEQMSKLLNNPSIPSLTLYIIDVDYFKKVNDKCGHLGGDMVLKKMAEILIEQVGATAEVCRWGGEEFAVLSRTAENSRETAQVILDSIGSFPFEADDKTLNITVSIGVTQVERNTGVSVTELVRRTDRCLYRAKELGRNRYEFCQYEA